MEPPSPPHTRSLNDPRIVVSGKTGEVPRVRIGAGLYRIKEQADGRHKKEGGEAMLYLALMFLVVGLIAGALNVAGVAAIAVQISWILFVIGIVLVVIHLIMGRRTSVE